MGRPDTLMSLKYAALLVFPVLLPDHESHTPTEVCSSSVRVLVPNMEEIIRETENFTKPKTLKTTEEISGASSSEESEGLISLDSMSSNLFCSGSYLESEPSSIVEFYCDDDLTIPAQWGAGPLPGQGQDSLRL